MLVLGFGFGMMSCQTRGHGMQSSEAKMSPVEATVVGKPVNKKERKKCVLADQLRVAWLLSGWWARRDEY
jgi:hypothetical protein